MENSSIWLWEKTYFWHSKGAVREITILGRYIVGNESYSIPFHFPKDTEWNFKSETNIFKIFHFWSKNYTFFNDFLTKNSKFWNFLSQTQNFILYLWESRKGCYNFQFLWYSDLKPWSRAQLLLNTKTTLFPTTK